MKKIALLITGLVMGLTVVKAQDTLIYENFNDTTPIPMEFSYPAATTADTNWYNWDADQLVDANSRPVEWFWTYPPTVSDSAAHLSCFASSSWFSTPGVAANWLITPAIQITDTSAEVSWLSAPFQTPLYLDGYTVLVSTTDNELTSFTDTLFEAAEYVSWSQADSTFASFTFAPASGSFVHGMDGTFIEYNGDSARFNGMLRQFTVSLAAYDDQMIYIAWVHDADDDNLIYIDDLLVTETTDPTFSIEELPDFAGQVYPNPATDFINVKFDIMQYHNAQLQITNSSGQIVMTRPLTEEYTQINLANISSGVYFVKMFADEGSLVKKIVVTK